MICPTCRTAADVQAPADQHCDTQPGPGAACDCQHRTDRYQPKPDDGPSAFDALWEQHLGGFYRLMAEATYLPPAACRCGGQNFAGQILHRAWCLWKNDPTRLRAVAEQALDERPDAQPFTIRSWPEPKVTPCPCGGAVIDGEPIHAPDCPVHPVRLHVIEAAATAALPAELRAGGIHFAFEPTTED